MYGLKRIEGRIRAISQIYSGGDEKTGITLGLNRLKYLLDDGESIEVPYVSGNEVRGFLRRLTFADFCELAGYEIDLKTISGKALFHTLMSGGILQAVEEKVSGTIDLSFKAKLYKSCPPARLFGFSFGNQMLEGHLKVSNMIPICVELEKFFPFDIWNDKFPGQVSFKPRSIYELLGVTFQTRRDDLREERGEKEQAVQMKVEHEVFCPGSTFNHELIIEDPNELILSTVSRIISLWQAKPYIGGKSSIGFGNINIAYDLDAGERVYLKFIEDNKKEINDSLGKLEALFHK